MNSQMLKIILVASLFAQAGCDVTFKKKGDADNNINAKSTKYKIILAKKKDAKKGFRKQDANIILAYYSDKANSIIRKEMIMHTKISKKQENKLKLGKHIPRYVQVMPLPLELERTLSSLPLDVLRVQVGVRVVLMNVKSRQILDIIKI